jgi:small subunit ribosomal protein S6
MRGYLSAPVPLTVLHRGNPVERRNPDLRTYELTLIAHPDMEEQAVKDLIDRIKNWISDSGGQVSKVDQWGLRQLAYPIRKQKEGQYIILSSQIEPAFCAELERNLRIQESVLRFLLTSEDAN